MISLIKNIRIKKLFFFFLKKKNIYIIFIIFIKILKKNKQKAIVIRNNLKVKIPAKSIVVGDVVYL